MWRRFVEKWNFTIERRPQTVVSTFLASQCTTWVGLFSVFDSASLLFPPEIVCGWMAARVTKKFRQPLNIGLAALTVRFVPRISELKVSPLLTGVVSGGHGSENSLIEMKKKIEGIHPSFKIGVVKIEKFATWAQGPIDQYGLAIYLASKGTSIATMTATGMLVNQGLDVPKILASWGMAGEFSDALACLAASSGANAFCFPLHFATAVHGTQAQERLAKSLALSFPFPVVDQQKQDSQLEEKGGPLDDEESYLSVFSLVLLTWTLAVSLYAFRIMSRKTNEKNEGDGTNNQVNLLAK